MYVRLHQYDLPRSGICNAAVVTDRFSMGGWLLDGCIAYPGTYYCGSFALDHS